MKQFENLIKSKTPKDIDWFFKDYIGSSKKIDFKIKKVSKFEDSIQFTIKNKRDHNMPVSLFMFNEDSIVSKTWVEHSNKEKRITVPRDGIDKLALNHDGIIPEFNL